MATITPASHGFIQSSLHSSFGFPLTALAEGEAQKIFSEAYFNFGSS